MSWIDGYGVQLEAFEAAEITEENSTPRKEIQVAESIAIVDSNGDFQRSVKGVSHR